MLFEGSGTVRELLEAPYAFVDDDLAPLFGVEAPGSPTPVRVALDATERAGLLTQPAFLAAHATPNGSSPSQRGRALRERLFCQPLPAPPDDVIPLVAPGPDHPTTRARYESHVTDERCASCHVLMDPLGFALEGYDGIGRRRAEEEGVVVDTHGEIVGTRSTDGAIEDGVALAHRVAASADVARCASERAWQLALRRTLSDADACDRASLDAAWQRSGGRLDELFVAIVRSDAFVAPRSEGP